MEPYNEPAQSKVVQAGSSDTAVNEDEPLDCWYAMVTELGHMLHQPQATASDLEGRAKSFVGRLHSLVQGRSDQALFVAVRALQDKRCPFSAALAMAMSAFACLMVEQDAELSSRREAVMLACLLMNISEANKLDETRCHLDHMEASSYDPRLVRHPEVSVDLLRRHGFTDESSLQLIVHHHESAAAGGAPTGLALTDQAVALVQLLERACEELSQTRRPPAVVSATYKALFDQARVPTALATLYFRCVGLYPPGTAVLLCSGERAVVCRKGAFINKPWVQSVVSPDGIWLKTPLLRDTADKKCEIVRVLPWHSIGLSLDKTLKAFWKASAPPREGSLE
jgi:hypothetical protein